MKTFQQSRRQARARRIVVVKPAPADANRAALQDALGYPVQTKLKVGAPDDAHEREADAVAERVMAAPEATVQRKCENCAQEDEEKKKDAEQSGPEKQEEEIQRKETGAAATASSATAAALGTGGGQSLAAGERAFFEPRLGADLGPVRIHADDRAARLSADLAARAFTVGRDVYFGAGEYRPGAFGGRRLIAHELAHVMQQRGMEPRLQCEAITLRAKAPDQHSNTGHAFVILEDANGVKNGRGLYPGCTKCGNQTCGDGDLMKMAVGIDIPGEVCGDLYHDYDKSVEYRIGAGEYGKAKTKADDTLSSPPDYDLLSYNCVDYVRALAAEAGVAVPDFPGVDEPVEMAGHIQDELDRKTVEGGTLALSGPAEVDLTQPEPTFSVTGLPGGHRLKFRWVIGDADDNRYLMWGTGGQVFQYGSQASAYIGSKTRQMLIDKGIRTGSILCRVLATRGGTTHGANTLLNLPVTFTW